MKTQALVVPLMVYATWLAVKCPCPRTLSCHLPDFFGAVGIAAGLVAYENYV